MSALPAGAPAMPGGLSAATGSQGAASEGDGRWAGKHDDALGAIVVVP